MCNSHKEQQFGTYHDSKIGYSPVRRNRLGRCLSLLHAQSYTYLSAPPMDEERAIRFLDKQSDPEQWRGSDWRALAVHHNDDDKVIGEVGVFVKPEPAREGDIGWMIHPEYHGRGYATEAAQILVRLAFEDRGLHRLTSGCNTRNVASWRLMERLGMRREGHSLQSRLLRGEWQDNYHYALLRDEWLKRKAAD